MILGEIFLTIAITKLRKTLPISGFPDQARPYDKKIQRQVSTLYGIFSLPRQK